MPVVEALDGHWIVECLECGHVEGVYEGEHRALDVLAEHWNSASCIQDGALRYVGGRS